MKTALKEILNKIEASLEYFNMDRETITAKILGSNNQTEKWLEIEMDGKEIYSGTYDTFEDFYSLDELEALIVNDKEFNAKSYKAVKNFYGEMTHMEPVYKWKSSQEKSKAMEDSGR